MRQSILLRQSISSMVDLPDPEIEGWLAQRGAGQGPGAKRVWKRRYFALIAETSALEFYERTRGKDGSGGKKGEIDLRSCRTIRASQAKDKRPHEIGTAMIVSLGVFVTVGRALRTDMLRSFLF